MRTFLNGRFSDVTDAAVRSRAMASATCSTSKVLDGMLSEDARLEWWYLYVDEETYAQCLAPFTREELAGDPDTPEELLHPSKLPFTRPQITAKAKEKRRSGVRKVNNSTCASLLHRWKYVLFCII